MLVALSLLGESASRRGKPLTQDAPDQVLRVAAAVLALKDEVRRRPIISLLHGTAREPFRAILKQFLEAHDMGALELIREEGREEGRQEGWLSAKAATLVQLLRKRGFTVDEAIEARILATTELEQLEIWLDRVLTAATLEEVLEG